MKDDSMTTIGGADLSIEEKLQHLDALLEFEQSPTPTSGLTAYSGLWTKKQVTHLLKRCMYGAKKSDIDYFLTRTTAASVDELITPLGAAPVPPLNHYTDLNSIADPNVPSGQTWVNAPWLITTDGSDYEYLRFRSFSDWWNERMILQNRSIVEKMVLFWHNLLATEYRDIGRARWAYLNNKLYRDNALGNYKTLIKKVTTDVQMLRYLNGYLNTKNAPDENYSRELQELFTLGIGSGYTEADVQEAAKVLTGYRTDNTGTAASSVYSFDPTRHHTGNKTFSAFYTNTIITGRTGTAGELELDDLINMIFSKDQVSLFFCREIYRFFVHYKIDATVEANIIVPLAQLLRTSNYEVAPVLKLLFKSQHFYDSLANGGMIKSPMDFLVGMVREFNVPIPPASPIKTYYAVLDKLRTESTVQSQELGNPVNVAGWPAYYQAPAFHRLWTNANTLQKRNKYSDQFANNGFTIQGFSFKINVIAYAATLSNPSDPNILIQDSIDYLLREDLSATAKAYLKTFLLTGQTNDSYWTTAWSAYIAAPTDTTAVNTVKTRLTNLYKYMMNLSEYQLM
ncbi:MAG: DUF1800 domain-containing protein [Saprospiraceae bacterium]|nr:DUF1800 domain-containing protein [Saprospiraceae bacterium]